jgi:hypothetical protein
MLLWEAKIPDDRDWSPEFFEDADDEWAYQKLFGKTSNEALMQLKSNSLAYTENLGAMPKAAFRFYFKVLVEYLLSEDSKGDPSAADGAFGLIKYDIQSGQNRCLELKAYLPTILREVANRQDFYDADIEIFGNFKEMAESIIQFIEQLP